MSYDYAPEMPYFEVSINPAEENQSLFVLFAGESQTTPEHILGPQVLDYYLIHTVLSGNGFFSSPYQRYELEEGDTFFIFPGELVSYGSAADKPWRYRWIALKGAEVDSLLHKAQITQEAPVKRGRRSEQIAALFHKMKLLLQQADHRIQLQTEAYFRLIVAEYIEPAHQQYAQQQQPVPAMQQQVEQAIRWFTLQYPQPISIDTVAATLGYHRTHFSKIFKKHTGMSPMQYLTHVRMERASLLLLHNKALTIQQVASSVGYTDALYFSKQFNKWFGCSPSRFRETN